jgi:DNA-binding transcriptional LysR family regulator
MDIDQIRTFVTISQLKSFSRAADVLHRSQPAISRRIELLSEELGAPLFERVNGAIALTDAGLTLMPYAEAVLAAARDGVDAVKALNSGESGNVSVALVGTLANDAFAAILRRLRKSHPAIAIDLQTANSREVGDLVRRGEATLGLRYPVDDVSGLISQTVARENLVVVCSTQHPLAKQRLLRPSQLARQKWVGFRTVGSRETFVQFLNRTLAAAGLDEPEVVLIDSLTAQKATCRGEVRHCAVGRKRRRGRTQTRHAQATERPGIAHLYSGDGDPSPRRISWRSRTPPSLSDD